MTSAILLLLAQLSTLGTPRSVAPSHPQSDVPVALTIRVAEGRRQFRPGETIPIELEFSSPIPKRFTVDATHGRSGHLTIDEFRIEPGDAVTDPLLDYFASSGGIGSGLRRIGVLGEQPAIVKLELNDWFRFDQPGTFRMSLRSQRVSDDAATTGTLVPVDSNTVSFEIVPRDAAWEATELEAARRILDANGSEIDRPKGCRMLRFLGTDAAVNEMIHLYGTNIDLGCDFDYMLGLFSAPNREHVVRQMENGLRAADQPVTASYLRTLAILSVYLDHPEFRPAQTREAKGRLSAGGEMSRHPDLIETASAGTRRSSPRPCPTKPTRLARLRSPSDTECLRFHRGGRDLQCPASNSRPRFLTYRPNAKPPCSSISGSHLRARPWFPCCADSWRVRRPPRDPLRIRRSDASTTCHRTKHGR